MLGDRFPRLLPSIPGLTGQRQQLDVMIF